MRRIVGGIGWHYEESDDLNLPALLMIHGFTGSLRSWDGFADLLTANYRVIAIDLPGHGKTPLPKDRELPLPRLADSVAELLRARGIEQVIVLGYSMGGRIALHLALQHQSLIHALVLIGASPGISNPKERQARWEKDCALAETIRERGIEWFSSFWEQQPIFQSQQRLSAVRRKALHKQRLANDPEGLTFALEQWSPGRQEDLLPLLGEIEIPMLLIAGELDAKYQAINEQIERQAQRADVTKITVPAGGHAAHFEQPEFTAQIINDYLLGIRNRL